MLNYKIINYKPEIEYNNEKFSDLMADTFVYSETINGCPIIVNEHYVGRPDLISLVMYGDDKYADVICKINGISNPFELNEDDILFIPSLTYVINFYKGDGKKSELIEDPSTSKIEKKDITTIYQKRKNEKRAPNQQTVGDSNYVIDKSLGVVFY